jgi:L-threonylcarbamoyladenylate synthase
MKKIKIDLKKINKNEISQIVDYLKRGRVIVYPTDTIYGIGCLALNRLGMKKINRMKERKNVKPFIVLVSSLNMVKKYCRVSQKQEKILKTVWPGPVTAILECRKDLPSEIFGDKYNKKGKNSLGVRLPKNDFLIKIIKKAGVPIVSTSLNVQGGKIIDRPFELEKYFTKVLPDLVIDAGVLKGEASRIIDIRDAENIKILR